MAGIEAPLAEASGRAWGREVKSSDVDQGATRMVDRIDRGMDTEEKGKTMNKHGMRALLII